MHNTRPRTPAQPDDHAADVSSSAPRFIQCRIPTALYEWMRLQGFLTRRSMNSSALAGVTAYRAEVEAGRIAPARGAPERGEVVTYNVRVGDELHAWLRTTAFDARTSINVLVVAALTRAHGDFVIDVEDPRGYAGKLSDGPESKGFRPCRTG